jgi:Type VI secretion, TssG
MGMTTSPFPEQQYPTMPNFAQGTAGFAHTVGSAVHVLDGLGVAESRLTLRMAGLGRPSLEIVRQHPPPGTPLTPSLAVTLWFAGLGFFDALPLPMRESGGEAEVGTRELCQLFDDPLQKAAQWLRAGAPLFNIGPGKFGACRRWLALFGMESATWPEELLYPLALLAPTLARMAARQVGIELAFLALLGLPICKFQYRAAHRLIEPRERSLLGSHASRLGSDFLLGDRQLDTDSITIQLGPVSLDTYIRFQSELGRRLIQMTTDICTSAYQSHSIAWVVEDARQAPRLGIASKNSRIGINFHLGRGASA